jgi:hypothetical protein
MDIVGATRSYEAWLGARLGRMGLAPVAADLRLKRRRMAKEDAFVFLRATYYRWAQRWPELCPELARAPHVLAAGDLHIENFGTWRDREGRLCWGINDFDEAHALSYASDLVRLAASALLAAEAGRFEAAPEAIADAVLGGYEAGLARFAPFVLEEGNPELRAMAYHKEKEPERWWKKLGKELFAQRPPAEARAALDAELPRAELSKAGYFYRSAGTGSLGRPRFVLRAEWRGGLIAREAKALVPSAAAWAARDGAARSHYADVQRQSAGSLDPLLRIAAGWVVRRLAPRSSKIELDCLRKKNDPPALLRAMGRAAANLHHGSAALPAIERDLARRKQRWLGDAAQRMAGATAEERRAWKRSGAWRR